MAVVSGAADGVVGCFGLVLPAEPPFVVAWFAGGVGEGPQPADECGVAADGDRRDDAVQFLAAASRDLVDQVTSGGGEGEPDRAPVGGGPGAADQSLADEAVAHPGAGRRGHAQLDG